MDIRNNIDGLKTLLGVADAAPAKTQQPKQASAADATFSGDRATLSGAGSEVALSAANSDVRMDKVSAVQSALADGAYNIPASAVATKVVDAMLGVSPSSLK